MLPFNNSKSNNVPFDCWYDDNITVASGTALRRYPSPIENCNQSELLYLLYSRYTRTCVV